MQKGTKPPKGRTPNKSKEQRTPAFFGFLVQGQWKGTKFWHRPRWHRQRRYAEQRMLKQRTRHVKASKTEAIRSKGSPSTISTFCALKQGCNFELCAELASTFTSI
eukprot:2577338-Amphidinium_carterae.1